MGIFSSSMGEEFKDRIREAMARRAQANGIRLDADPRDFVGIPSPGGPGGIAGNDRGPAGDRLRFKKGGKAKKMAKGGSASRRADGCATKGKTKGRFV